MNYFDVLAVGTQTVFLEAQVATFTRHRTRLAVVREQKEKARLDMLGEICLLLDIHLQQVLVWILIVFLIITCLHQMRTVQTVLMLSFTLRPAAWWPAPNTLRATHASPRKTEPVVLSKHYYYIISVINDLILVCVYLLLPWLQEIIKEPTESWAEEAQSEGGKPDGGPSADVRARWDHHHRGQDERYRPGRHYVSRVLKCFFFWRCTCNSCCCPPAEEVHGLLKALVLFQFDKQAEKLQLAYEEALHMMETSVPEVWPDGLHNNQAPVTDTRPQYQRYVVCTLHLFLWTTELVFMYFHFSSSSAHRAKLHSQQHHGFFPAAAETSSSTTRSAADKWAFADTGSHSSVLTTLFYSSKSTTYFTLFSHFPVLLCFVCPSQTLRSQRHQRWETVSSGSSVSLSKLVFISNVFTCKVNC